MAKKSAGFICILWPAAKETCKLQEKLARILSEIWGGLWPVRTDHSELGSKPKLNFSVLVTPACAAYMEAELLVACETPELGPPSLVGHVSICCSRLFLQILVVLATTNTEVVVCGGQGPFGVVLSHSLDTLEVRLLSSGFSPINFCAVVTNELQSEFIYEHVEGAEWVASTE